MDIPIQSHQNSGWINVENVNIEGLAAGIYKVAFVPAESLASQLVEGEIIEVLQ